MPDSKEILSRVERIANVGHWRYDVVENHLFWSDEIYRIHGLDFNDYTPEVEAAIDAFLPEDRSYVEDVLTEAIENKEPFEFQRRIRRPNGEIRHVVSHGECEVDADGNVLSVFGTLHDVTFVKQQEELYELAALGSNAALWDWNIKHDTLRWAGRSAEILGLKSKRHLPDNTNDFLITLLHKDDQEKVKDTFAKHFKDREPFSMEVRIKTQNGEYRWFYARAQAQWDELGKAARICGSLNDIHELKQAQEKLERSNYDLQQFATIAAHDLKAPLRSISGFLEILREKYAEKLDETALEYIDHSVKGAEDLGTLIDDMLAYASLKNEGINLTTVNLDNLLKVTLRTMKAWLKETEAEVEFDRLPTLECDENKIKRLLFNLIENGLKYKSERKPHIKIKAEKKSEEWLFSVQDNGIGMDQKNLNDIFLMFNRLHNKSHSSGTGIGLAICKRIVELHGGTIWAESEKDKGSTFFFTIPDTPDTKI